MLLEQLGFARLNFAVGQSEFLSFFFLFFQLLEKDSLLETKFVPAFFD